MLDFERLNQPQLRVYEPNASTIVLGASRSFEADVYEKESSLSAIPVVRRRGGGGTVFLSKGQVVICLVTKVAELFENKKYTWIINRWVISELERLGVKFLSSRGISDLAISNRKIMGTTVFRRRHIFFYQASLLVNNNISDFSKFLKFPSVVPDYRRGRDHSSFCTNLQNEGYNFSPFEITKLIYSVILKKITDFK